MAQLERSKPALDALDSLDKLAAQLLDVKFHPWSWQMDLLELQQTLAQGIRELKRGPREADFEERLYDLRCVQHLARRLGSAFAWLLFGLNEPKILSLCTNSLQPTPPKETVGSKSMLVAAQHLWTQGWGIPVLHDITDCLRIGDVTFSSFTSEREPKLTTVEIKSRVVSETRVDADHVQVEVVISSFVDGELPPEAAANVRKNDAERPPGFTTRRSRRDSRSRRQIARMLRAAEISRAANQGVVTLSDGEGYLSIGLTEQPDHWDQILRTIDEARKKGSASERLDDATVLVAMFSAEGVTPGLVDRPEIYDSLANLRDAEDVEEDAALMLVTCPGMPDKCSPRAMPFFLSNLPRDAIFDLLHERLVLIMIVYRGALRRMLARVGLDLVSRTGESGFWGESFVLAQESPQDGRNIGREAHEFGVDLFDCLSALRSADAFVVRAQGLFARLDEDRDALLERLDASPADAAEPAP